jgi:PAS domain S-box-containing protein
MKLRLILLVLSLLAFLSASTGGFMYYSSLEKVAMEEADRQSAARVQTIKKSLSAFLSENIKPVRALAGMDQLQTCLIRPDDGVALENANRILDHFNCALETEVCYVMDHRGHTIASSNRMAVDSFVGENFEFRPYFQQAVQGKPASYLALGTTSGRRGAYYSHPIIAEGRRDPIGVVVIKASIELIERDLVSDNDEVVLVTDPHGVIFISNRKEWLYHSVQKLSDDRRDRIARSLQFGEGPWNWIGIQLEGEKHAVDRHGDGYLMHRIELDDYPGWNVIHLLSLAAISRTVSDPLIRIAGPSILALCVLIGVSVFFLYRKASVDIMRRQAAESALRESEERYRSLYNHTPAMLHSIDRNGRLISVSDYWLEILGYERDEVVGRKLTDFFAESSRRYAEETVFPKFFETGVCKDIAYQFIRKNGDIIDISLSAITDRELAGKPVRSLAVSIDVTERKRAEEALQRAQEELRRYSQDLERQVQKRTQEVTSILEQLRRLSGSIMDGQEKERSAIARELHDEFGQLLTALRMDSVWLRDRLKDADVKASERALTMCTLIDKAIEGVRSLAIRLRPDVLDTLGLVDALEWVTTDFEKRTSITCFFKHRAVPAIRDTLATAAYRITQEALTNIARHAKASRVDVALGVEDGTLSLVVSDDGLGFDVHCLKESDGLGLAGMRERASLVGGTLDVRSQSLQGTRVNFRAPLNSERSG